MKSIYLIIVLGLCLAGTAAPVNTLKPVSGEASEVVFTGDGSSKLVIWLAGKNPAREKEAAAELQNGLKKITGSDFKLVNAQPSQGNFIHLEDSGSTDAFTIKAADGNIHISGNALNGALALLEEDLGCRWYGTGLEYYPSRPELIENIVSREDIPAFVRRNPFTNMSYHKDFTRRNRILFDDGFGYLSGWFCHTYDNIIPQTDFAAKPECFMVDEHGKRNQRQLCPSNPEVQRLAREKVLEALRNNKNPQRNLVSFSQNDYPIYCHCAPCMATIRKHGNAPVAPHLLLANTIAREMSKEFPDARLVILGYHHTQKTPVNLEVEPNIRLWFCITDEDNSLSKLKSVVDMPSVKRNLEEWNKLKVSLEIWDYMVDFTNYFMPFPSFMTIANNLKFYKQQSCIGVMLQGKREDIAGDRVEMRAWVMSKLLWNPDRDMRELVKDFNYGVYGAAAPMMEEYFDLVEAGTPGTYYFRNQFIGKSKEYFARGKQALAEAGQNDLIPRLELAMLPILMLELDRQYTRQAPFKAAEYTEALNAIRRITTANAVRSYRENVPMSKYLSDRQIMLDTLEGNNEIKINAEQFTLYRDIGARLIDDPLSESGKTAEQLCNDTWSLQWTIPFESLRKWTRYKLYIQVRAPIPNNLVVGIHDSKNRASVIQKNIPGNDLSAAEYRWIEIGEFKPGPNYYFWSAGVKQENARTVLIQALKLVPVK